jgi:hypothetical protein
MMDDGACAIKPKGVLPKPRKNAGYAKALYPFQPHDIYTAQTTKQDM